MWPFSKKYSLQQTGIFQGFTDYHSHILPGVDDGIKTMEGALNVLKYYEELGVKTVWLTPHIMEDMPNKPEELKQRFAELQQAYNGPVTLHLAAENMLDSLFAERLEQGDLLPYGINKDQLLVETSYVSAPYGFPLLLQKIRKAGYTPVLAHPERYRYMDYEQYERLRAQGVRFQLNVMSLAGGYGPEAKERAEYLLEEEYYTYSGTDIHALQYFKDTVTSPLLKKKVYNLLHKEEN